MIGFQDLICCLTYKVIDLLSTDDSILAAHVEAKVLCHLLHLLLVALLRFLRPLILCVWGRKGEGERRKRTEEGGGKERRRREERGTRGEREGCSQVLVPKVNHLCSLIQHRTTREDMMDEATQMVVSSPDHIFLPRAQNSIPKTPSKNRVWTSSLEKLKPIEMWSVNCRR